MKRRIFAFLLGIAVVVSPSLTKGVLSSTPGAQASASSAPTFIIPTQGVLTSGFGRRWGRMHRGIDIGAPIGTPIVAAAGGSVEFSGWRSGGFGNLVEIRHLNGSMTRYAHNSRNLVQVGTQVEQGQPIALVGNTGRSTGAHVHFELHLPRRGAINPMAYLPRSIARR